MKISTQKREPAKQDCRALRHGLDDRSKLAASFFDYVDQLPGLHAECSISIVTHLLFERLSNEPHYIGEFRFLTQSYFYIARSR